MSNPLQSFLIGSAGWFGVSHSEAIPAVRDAGFGGVEILCKPGHFEPENSAHIEEIQAALAHWPDAIVTFHAPFHTADLSSTDPAEWQRSMTHVAHSMRVASTFRAESATIHTRGAGQKEWFGDNLPAFRRSLDALVPVATECDMTLSVENMAGERFASQPEDLLGLLEGYSAKTLGVCFDTGHAHLTGATVAIAGALASRTYIMHIHDNHAVGKDEHNVPGQGTIPWPELVEALQTNGYKGRNVIEFVMRDFEGNTVENFSRILDIIAQGITTTGLTGLNGSC